MVDLEMKIKDLEETIKKKTTDNADLVSKNEALEGKVKKLEKELKDSKGAQNIVAGEKGAELSKEDLNLIDEGCKAYGISPKFVMNSRIDKAIGEAVILTNGGAKVRYSKGMEVEPLSEIKITGINPNAKKKKPIAGKVKGKK